MGVGLVPVLSHQLTVDADVELTVTPWDELEVAYVVPRAVKRLARHPGGSERMASRVAVEYLYIQLGIFGHAAPPTFPRIDQAQG